MRPGKQRLGILKAGSPPRSLSAFGTYPGMFQRLLGEDHHDYVVFDVEHGEWPASADRCPAYMITGSASDAYGAAEWISDLKQFLNAAKGRAALVGICFGHQVMAEAFGGKVEKSPNGWGMGNHTYDVVRAEPWAGLEKRITLAASHQDQVIRPPPACEVVAGNAFTPFGFLAYTDQPAISLQLHPEFERDFAAALIEKQRGRGLSDMEADHAIASLRQTTDRDLVAGWINRFIEINA